MFCSNCGKKIKDNWNVCPACGIVIEKKDSINSSNASVTNMETQKIKKAKRKKPIYKKIWFWILILFVGFLLISTGSDETENEVPITLEEAGGFSVWEENGFEGLVRTDIIVNLPVVERDVNNYGVTIGALAIDNIVVVQENNAPVNEWEWLMNAKPYLKDGDKAYFKATLKYANMNTEDEYNYPVFIISDIEAYPAYEENEILEGNLSEEEIENEEIEIEEVHETKNVDYEFIYGGILDSIPSGLSYTFYDIDKDGYQECLAQQGTCNADMIFEIYTTDGKSTAKLGEILGADTTLYECKNKNGLYTYYARGDYELVEYVYIDDGSLKIETVAEDNTYSNITSPEVQHPLSMINVSTEKEDYYLFSESNSSYYNIEALYSGYDYKTLWYGKNEIYARHGYIFKNSELQAYFEEQAWYTPTIEGAKFDEGVFNDYEKANIETFQTILEYYNSEESSEEISSTSSYEEFYQDGIIPRPGVYRNDNSPFFITIEEGVYGNVYTDVLVYINLYCQMEGDDYQEEYTGMINLYNPGMLTIMTGVQSAAYIEYDCGLGKLSGSGVQGIVNDYIEMHRYYNLNMYDYDFYEDNEVNEYYLDK